MYDDDDIIELLIRMFNCKKVKKVGSLTNKIVVERRKKIGVKKKILGVFPVYEYETWSDKLSNWNYTVVVKRNNLTGREVANIKIGYCYDGFDGTLYWKYAL